VAMDKKQGASRKEKQNQISEVPVLKTRKFIPKDEFSRGRDDVISEVPTVGGTKTWSYL